MSNVTETCSSAPRCSICLQPAGRSRLLPGMGTEVREVSAMTLTTAGGFEPGEILDSPLYSSEAWLLRHRLLLHRLLLHRCFHCRSVLNLDVRAR